MSPPTFTEVQQRHGRTWQIMDFHGGWLAIRHHFWSAAAERFGIRNVLGADTLAKLAAQLEEQAKAETLRRGQPLPAPED